MIMKSPSVEGLVQTLASLTREQYARLRCHVEALPIDQFVDVHDTLGMARMALHGSQRQAANSAQGTLGGSSSSSSLTS
jgi:hypothetical protein